MTHLGLLPVQVELMLRDGALPDALCQALSLAEPYVDVDGAGVEGSAGDGHLGGGVGDGVHQLLVLGATTTGAACAAPASRVQLERVLVEVEAAEGLHDPLGVVDLDGELLVAKVQVLQLLPREDPDGHLPVGVSVLRDAPAAEPEPPGRLALVVHLEVVDAVRRHRLHDRHVVDHGLPAGLPPHLLVVLDHLLNADFFSLK